MSQPLEFQGTKLWKGLLSREVQVGIVADLRSMSERAPLRRYVTPGGREMSVRMSGAGARAWLSDKDGYRYSEVQPDGRSWPEIPSSILRVWKKVADVSRSPDSCLVNFYGEDTKMGLHQDRDEAELNWPVVSISLGDDALFRVGGVERRDPTKSVWLTSGDVVVLAGPSRLAYHGIDRVKFGSSSLLPRGGRINVTLRVAT